MAISKLTLASLLTLSVALAPLPAMAQITSVDGVNISKPEQEKRRAVPLQPRIQIALLLDTSNSMDGLIDQAKSQLWTLVNELGEGTKNGRAPIIEIALYEYGNSNISVSKGYVRQVVSLTTDLDDVSEKLFGLSTDGGQEFAGQVIMTSLDELEWSNNPSDMKLIIIAGNEEFTQGPVSYESACARAKRGGIIIDTIHCGSEQEGIKGKWRAGAECADGLYMTIDQDEKYVHIPSPYDDDIIRLNKELNTTYIGYGAKGFANKERQTVQDSNAQSMSTGVSLKRARSKASASYRNESWDLVDAYEKDKDKVMTMEETELPEELQGKTSEERAAFIEAKQTERTALQAEIKSLSTKQTEFVSGKRKEMSETKTLDNVMVTAVRKQAAGSGYDFK